MTFLICCLACWRICHFIAKEMGPFDFMWDVRYYLSRENVDEWCVGCLSVYVAIPFAAYCFDINVFIYWLAIAAGSMILEQFYAVLWSKT